MQRLRAQTLAIVLVGGLVLAIIGSGAFAVAVRGGTVPYFDQRIALDAQHILVLHNGPEPTCAIIPSPHGTIASGLIASTMHSLCTI